MDSVKLMDRVDTKFMLSSRGFGALLNELRKSYKCLEVEGNRASRYETVYLDTEKLDFYIKQLFFPVVSWFTHRMVYS